MSDTTHDVGTVKEGEEAEAEFRFINETQESLDLTWTGSCGCSSVILTPKIAPGDVGTCRVKIKTQGKSGNVQEYVEIAGNGKPRLSFWIVGKVLPGIRLVCDPHILTLGNVHTGVELRYRVIVEAVCTKEPTQFGLKLGEPLQRDIACEGAWENNGYPIDQVGDGADIRQRFGLNLRIRPNALGHVDEVIPIEAVDERGITRTVTGLPICANVSDGFEVHPEIVYLGVVNVQDGWEGEIRVTPSLRSFGQLIVQPSCEWIQVKRVQRDGERFCVYLRAVPSSKGHRS